MGDEPHRLDEGLRDQDAVKWIGMGCQLRASTRDGGNVAGGPAHLASVSPTRRWWKCCTNAWEIKGDPCQIPARHIPSGVTIRSAFEHPLRISRIHAPLNAVTHPRITKFARASAVLLTVLLFTLGNVPATGHAFPGVLHWIAHLSAYALICFAAGLGWPRQSAVLIAAIVAAIGLIHESTEIITHSHGFETADAIVNAIGAIVGVAVQRTAQIAISR